MNSALTRGRRVSPIVAALVAAAWLGPAQAQDFTPADIGVAPLFADDSTIEIVIEAPLTTLQRTAETSTDPHPARLSLSTASGPQTFDVAINARGVTRRTGDICRFPPLRVDFDKDAVGETLFDGQNRLKLVTYCKNLDSYEQLYVLEYLAYRFYNVVTPLSFRVRPAQITYRDQEGRQNEITRFGFFIEDDDDLAERNGLEVLDTVAINASQLDPAVGARYALFQFMIGNLDWSFLDGPGDDDCCHNTKLLVRADSPEANIIPAPYDFDFSGFVDASYASPPEAIPVRSVRQRYYRGMCGHASEVSAAVAEFQGRRADFAALIADEPRLSNSSRRQAQRYIDNFFDVIGDSRRFDRAVTRRCRE
jgi:hypothetical protein